MAELRFLERLRSMERDPLQRGMRDATEVVASVTRHLSHILNTRKGSALFDPEFGLPDYTNFGASFSEITVEHLKTSMEALIRRYEPRLVNLRVSPRQTGPDAMDLSFDLEAAVALDDCRIPVAIVSRIGHNGEVQIRLRNVS